MSPKRLKYFGPTRVSAMEAAKLIDITSWINSLSLPSRIIFPPERLVLGTVQTVWDFPDIWIIPVIFFSIRPLLIVLSAVLRIMKHSEWRYWQGWGYYVKKYDESNLKQLEGPLKALCIPLLLNFLISQVLNTAFTYKMVKPGILKKITVLSHNINDFTYLVWVSLSVFHLKNRYLYKIFGKSRSGRRLMPALNKLLTIGIGLIVTAAGLKVLGLHKESLGLAGIASVAFALATQNALSQFISSLILCNPESSISVGDYIMLLGVDGEVSDIGWFATTIVTPDSTPIVIPNTDVLQAKVSNISLNTKRRMVEEFAIVPEAPEDAFAAVEEIREMLWNSGIADTSKEIRCHVWGFKGTGLLVRLECNFDAPGTNPQARDIELDSRHAVMERVVRILARHRCKMGGYPVTVVAAPDAQPP